MPRELAPVLNRSGCLYATQERDCSCWKPLHDSESLQRWVPPVEGAMCYITNAGCCRSKHANTRVVQGARHAAYTTNETSARNICMLCRSHCVPALPNTVYQVECMPLIVMQQPSNG